MALRHVAAAADLTLSTMDPAGCPAVGADELGVSLDGLANRAGQCLAIHAVGERRSKETPSAAEVRRKARAEREEEARREASSGTAGEQEGEGSARQWL